MQWHTPPLWHAPTKANLVWPSDDDEYDNYSWTWKGPRGKAANINHVIQSNHEPNHKYFKVNTKLRRTSADRTFIQEFYEFYDAKLHNLWRYKFTNVFNLSMPLHAPWDTHKCRLMIRFHRAKCSDHLPTEFDISQRKIEPLALCFEWMKPAMKHHDQKHAAIWTARMDPFLGSKNAKYCQPLIEFDGGFKTTYPVHRELARCQMQHKSKLQVDS